MQEETCILTAKDFTILEAMRDRDLGRDPSLEPILRRKIETAQVVFREDVPADVATMSSRVTFRVDGRGPETRVISHDLVNSALGLFLPITTPRGLALLGLTEGQSFVLTNSEGVEERILLEKLHFQPEAAMRAKALLPGLGDAVRPKPTLTVIRGALHDQTRVVTTGSGGFDDPGPSAA